MQDTFLLAQRCNYLREGEDRNLESNPSFHHLGIFNMALLYAFFFFKYQEEVRGLVPEDMQIQRKGEFFLTGETISLLCEV